MTTHSDRTLNCWNHEPSRRLSPTPTLAEVAIVATWLGSPGQQYLQTVQSTLIDSQHRRRPLLEHEHLFPRLCCTPLQVVDLAHLGGCKLSMGTPHPKFPQEAVSHYSTPTIRLYESCPLSCIPLPATSWKRVRRQGDRALLLSHQNLRTSVSCVTRVMSERTICTGTWTHVSVRSIKVV